GNSPGNLTVGGGLALNAFSTYLWQLAAETTAGPGTNFDAVTLTTGSLTVDPTAVLLPSFVGAAAMPDAADPFWQAAERWSDVIGLTGTAANAGGSAFVIDNSVWASAGAFSTVLNADGQSIDLLWTPTAAPVPEPAAVFALAVAALAAARAVRTR